MGDNVVWIRKRFIQVITSFFVLLVHSIGVLAIGFDVNFGTNGRTLIRLSTDNSSSAFGTEVFVDAAGGIFVVAGFSQQGTTGRTSGFGIIKLNSGGGLTSYGENGKILIWSPDISESVRQAAIDSAGKILVLSTRGTQQIALKRFNLNGSLDTTFRPDLPVDSDSGIFPYIVKPGANGKIYVFLTGLGQEHYILRLNADGSRDSSFGVNGLRNLDLSRLGNRNGLFYSGLAEVSGNKLILTGSSFVLNNFFAVRFNSDGFIDRSFGRQGVVWGGFDRPLAGSTNSSVVLQDGTIFMGGTEGIFDTTTTVFKLLPRGRPDNTFGRIGKVSSSFQPIDSMQDIHLMPDGKVYAVGNCGLTDTLPFRSRVFVVRYSQTGQQEATFQTDFDFDRTAFGTSIARHTDGKMIIAGSSSTAPPSSTGTDRYEIAVAKLNH